VATPELTEFNAAARVAAKIKTQVLTRQMPPWPAAPGFGDFANDASLTPYEIDVLVSWADAGMPRGLADPLIPTPVSLRSAASPEPDLLLQPDTAVAIESNRQRLVLPARLSRERWLHGWEFRPGNRAIVRQARISAEPGGLLGVWVPSQSAVFFPSGAARRLTPRANIVVDIEYERPPDPATDRSGVALYFGDKPARELRQMTVHRGTTTLREDVVAFAIRPELQSTGESVRVLAERPDGHAEVLVWVRAYDPRHPITYRFRRPVSLPAGTHLTVFSFDAESTAHLEFVTR
jgi:hypothetical protein